MKKIYTAILAVALALPSFGQELPAPSPMGKVSQRVGLTDINIEYSRPSKKGRTVFGELVPYGEMWRLGANLNTTIEFTHPITWNGEMVPAGKYSMYAIPNEKTWTIILNSGLKNWGVNGYDKDQDIARTDVEVIEGPMTESLTISVEDLAAEGAEVVISWDEVKVEIPIKVDIHTYAEANIKAAIESGEDKYRVHRNAAQYYLQVGKNEVALKMIMEAVKDKDANWYTHFLHGQILHANGKDSEARKAMNKAIEIGEKEAKDAGNEFGYKVMIEQTMRSY